MSLSAEEARRLSGSSKVNSAAVLMAIDHVEKKIRAKCRDRHSEDKSIQYALRGIDLNPDEKDAVIQHFMGQQFVVEELAHDNVVIGWG